MNYEMGLAFLLLGIGFFIISISKTLDQIREENREFRRAITEFLERTNVRISKYVSENDQYKGGS